MSNLTKFIYASDSHDLLTARKRRDEMLAAFDSGKAVPHLNNK